MLTKESLRQTPTPFATVLLPLRLWIVLCFCLAGGAGQGQDSTPRDEQLTDTLVITDERGEIGFEADYLEEEQSRDGERSFHYRNLTLEEYVRLGADGYVYHPRFMTFRGDLKLGLLQQFIKRYDEAEVAYDRETETSSLREYDFYATFLKDHLLSADVFARRDYDIVRQIFSDKISVENETIGAHLRWKKQPVPMDLSVRQNRMWQRGMDSRSYSRQRILEYTASHNYQDKMQTRFKYRYQDYLQNFEAENDYLDIERKTRLQTHDLSVDNRIFLDESKQSYLQSTARFLHQSGSQDIQNIYWQERLHLQHAPNLHTYYLADYQRNDFESDGIQSYRAEAGIEHRLYDSLNSHLDVHWRDTDYDQAADTEYGVSGRLDYRKSTPLGYLSSGYGLTIDQMDRSGASRTRKIVDERLTLNGRAPQFLSKPDVIAGSIVVTDQARQVRYTALDYEIIERGNRTGLQLPVITAEIQDGDTVLVTYEVETTSDMTYQTIAQNFNLRHDFEKGRLDGLSTYLRWNNIDQSGDVQNVSVMAMNSRMVGASYRWRNITWSEEYEQYRSNYTDYDQLRSQIEGSHPLSPSLRWGWNVGMLNTDYSGLSSGYRGPNDYTDAYYAGSTLRGRIRDRGFWQIEARGRREIGTVEETVLGVLGKVGFQWRKMHFNLGAQFETRERYESERERIHVFLGVSRDL